MTIISAFFCTYDAKVVSMPCGQKRKQQQQLIITIKCTRVFNMDHDVGGWTLVLQTTKKKGNHNTNKSNASMTIKQPETKNCDTLLCVFVCV